jgi:hypothetical protein
MIRIYSEKEPLEQIILEEETYKVLSNIVYYHSDICLNITESEFNKEIESQEFIFQIIHSKGGKGITPYQQPFDALYNDMSLLVNESQALYILNVNPDEAEKLSASNGVIVLSAEKLEEAELAFFYSKDLPKDYVCESEGKIGYHDLLNVSLPPFNCLLISDQYLFENENGLRGEKNIIQFIKAILPTRLDVDFHLMIVSPENNLMNTKSCSKLTGKIKTAIKNLELNYDVCFEMVYSETIHKRIASSNTFNIVMDRGFATFTTSDMKTVIADNDISITGLFVRAAKNQGDTELDKNQKIIKRLARICDSTKEYISNRKEDKNKRIFGDCEKDKSVNNRLIREFI